MKSMDEAHRDDYADQARMRELRQAIKTFLDDPPTRAHRTTLDHLSHAVRDLKDDEAHIVRVWD